MNSFLSPALSVKHTKLAIAIPLICVMVLSDTSIANAQTAGQAGNEVSTETQLRAIQVRDKADVQRDELPPAYEGGQVARGGELGFLGNKSVLDMPFNLTSFTLQTIEDQQAMSVGDILINDSSVRLTSARSNINEGFSIRGFPIASQDVALNGMYGLVPFFRVPIEMAERVEVLKGPSALLNGMSPSGSIGGAVNVVAKRARAEPLTRVNFSYLSDSIYGAHVDAGRRFGTEQEFGVRFNGVYRGGDTAIDKQSQRDKVGSLGLDYTIERLRLSADVIYQHQDIDGVVRQFFISPTLTEIPSAPDNDIGYPGFGYSEMSDRTWAFRGEYDFNEHVTAYAAYGDRYSKMNGLTGNPMLLNTAGDFGGAPAWQVYSVSSHSAEGGLRTQFKTGPIDHSLTVGATRLIQNSDIFFLNPFGATRLSNIYDPVYSNTPSTDGYSANALKFTTSELKSFAIADTLSFLEGHFELTVGARKQKVEAQNYAMNVGTPSGEPYDDDATTPLVGLVFKPTDHISLYGNYIEGLTQGPTAPLSGVSNPGEMLAPMKTKQHEFGAKFDWGRFTTTVSVYQIKTPSAFIEDGRYDTNGEQRNRGIELAIFGEVTPGVRLLGGGSYTRPELTSTTGGVNDGNDAIGVPRKQINLCAEWDTPFVPGLTVNSRVIYLGKQYADAANNLSLPDWTTLNIGARYKLDIFEKPVVLRANLNNALNEEYWNISNGSAGYLYVGEPRTLELSATVDF